MPGKGETTRQSMEERVRSFGVFLDPGIRREW